MATRGTVIHSLDQSLLNQVCLSLVQNDLRVRSVDHYHPQVTGSLTVKPSLFWGTPSLLRGSLYLLCGSLFVRCLLSRRPASIFLSFIILCLCSWRYFLLQSHFRRWLFSPRPRRNFLFLDQVRLCATDGLFWYSPTFVSPAIAHILRTYGLYVISFFDIRYPKEYDSHSGPILSTGLRVLCMLSSYLIYVSSKVV